MKNALKIIGLSALLAVAGSAHAAKVTILNSSYDIARELFAAYNPLFSQYYLEKTGDEVSITQSHAGSSKQARAILQGLRADVVTFNQVTDIQILHDQGKIIPKDWKSRLANGSSPYYSTTAYLVREGNPKNIHDWGDIVSQKAGLVFPNPKTSGNGRYTYLAALGYAQQKFGSDQAKIEQFLRDFLHNVKVFDTGGRGATTTFVERKIGDVLITFESEVNNIKAQYPDQKFEVVVPKTSILAEFPVAWLDKNIAKNKTEAVAKEYLNYLYSQPAQRLLASFNYRVHDPKVVQENAAKFPETKLLTVEEIVGSWEQAMREHFASGAKLDQLQKK